MENRKLDFIQALRGIAAMLVVLSHAGDNLKGTPYAALNQAFFWPGVSGVDLFFIISGIVMVVSTRNLAGSAHDSMIFVVKRLARIWPLYIVATLLYLLVTGSPNISSSTFAEYALPIKSMLFIPPDLSAMAPYFGPPALFVGWTLNFEIFFYACFAVSLLFGRWRYPALFVIGIAISLVIPYLDHSLSVESGLNPHHRLSYFNLTGNCMVWEFFVGVVVGLVYTSTRLSFPSTFLANVALVGAAALEVWAYFSGFYDGNGPTRAGFIMAIFLLVLMLASKSTHVPAPKWLASLGDISYSLYLTHPIALLLLHKYFVHTQREIGTHSPAYLVLAVGFCVVFASLSWRYVEIPLERMVRAWTLCGIDRSIKRRGISVAR
ncbi:acyltransferase 3 [Caballeronia telluris]|uniref:Acyltransferase 3 n=2 Tax=Caballeronia telluris TaxID=326475 RepID=A0A158G118_9BURK|nr:acyltransferase 3 [Caballeronia telluris]